MENTNLFLGQHTWEFHVFGLLFSLVGGLVVKRHFWLIHKAKAEGVCDVPVFTIKGWLREHGLNMLASLAASFFFIRFLDVFLHMTEKESIDFLTMKIPVTADTLFYYLLAGGLIQIWFHKKYEKRHNHTKTDHEH